jgi:hypothetical protein
VGARDLESKRLGGWRALGSEWLSGIPLVGGGNLPHNTEVRKVPEDA